MNVVNVILYGIKIQQLNELINGILNEFWYFILDGNSAKFYHCIFWEIVNQLSTGPKFTACESWKNAFAGYSLS